MIVCPHCNHSNPEGATQCEACYGALPALIDCPNCGSSVQVDALFCGQCGFNLTPGNPSDVSEEEQVEEEQILVPPTPTPTPPSPESARPTTSSQPTQVQVQKASLFHVQTKTTIELPLGLPLVHIGKPNDQIPPDLDVSGFPGAEIVSRVHADLRVEADGFYIEDVGSSNGTYINHSPLPTGDRHRLRTGDRIALGKGDKVTFIFQLNE